MFYLIVLVALFAATFAVQAKQIMHGIISLAIFLLSVAVLFYMMNAPYLAIGQILIFVGGFISLLVLTFNFTHNPHREDFSKSNLFKLIIIGIFVSLVLLLAPLGFSSQLSSFSLAELANVVFVKYGFLVNVAFLVILAAVISAMYMLQKEPEND
jgi:NADH-quinone oxidoreductase subunit J